MQEGAPGPLEPEVAAFYALGCERERLSLPPGELEAERTRAVLRGLLPPAPATIADIGGGPGHHACWLAELGHDVLLVDGFPLHVEQAQELARTRGVSERVRADVGDARALGQGDGSVDAALLLGPLYHLTSRAERVQALAECGRIVRPGGLIAAAGISRCAPLLDGLRSGALVDPLFRALAEADLRTGMHRPPPGKPWFTTAYFTDAAELESEAAEAGLEESRVVGLEGIGVYLPDLAERWADPARREQVLFAAQALEEHQHLRELSPHLLLLARSA